MKKTGIAALTILFVFSLGIYAEEAKEVRLDSLEGAKNKGFGGLRQIKFSDYSQDLNRFYSDGEEIAGRIYNFCALFPGFKDTYSPWVMGKIEEKKDCYAEIIFPGVVYVKRIVLECPSINYGSCYNNSDNRTIPGLYNFEVLYNDIKYAELKVLRKFEKNSLFKIEIKDERMTNKIRVSILPIKFEKSNKEMVFAAISNLQVYGYKEKEKVVVSNIEDAKKAHRV